MGFLKKNFQAKGCKTACKFYKRTGDSPVRAVTGKEWVFPVRASASTRGFREVSISWTRPRLISSKKQLLISSTRVSVVYVLFRMDDYNLSPVKISMVCLHICACIHFQFTDRNVYIKIADNQKITISVSLGHEMLENRIKWGCSWWFGTKSNANTHFCPKLITFIQSLTTCAFLDL